MANQTLQVESITSTMTVGESTITTSKVIEALEQLKDIPEQTKADMSEAIQDSIINKLQDVIELPWADTALEYLPDLIELLKLL
jgi:hypothetical protein